MQKSNSDQCNRQTNSVLIKFHGYHIVSADVVDSCIKSKDTIVTSMRRPSRIEGGDEDEDELTSMTSVSWLFPKVLVQPPKIKNLLSESRKCYKFFEP